MKTAFHEFMFSILLPFLCFGFFVSAVCCSALILHNVLVAAFNKFIYVSYSLLRFYFYILLIVCFEMILCCGCVFLVKRERCLTTFTLNSTRTWSPIENLITYSFMFCSLFLFFLCLSIKYYQLNNRAHETTTTKCKCALQTRMMIHQLCFVIKLFVTPLLVIDFCGKIKLNHKDSTYVYLLFLSLIFSFHFFFKFNDT